MTEACHDSRFHLECPGTSPNKSSHCHDKLKGTAKLIFFRTRVIIEFVLEGSCVLFVGFFEFEFVLEKILEK